MHFLIYLENERKSNKNPLFGDFISTDTHKFNFC